MSTTVRLWVQRAVVVVAVVVAIVLWRSYQTRNDLSTAEAGQRFIDAVDGAWWGIVAYIGVYLLRPLVLFPASVLTVAGGILWKFTVITRACHQQGYALPMMPQRGSGRRRIPSSWQER